MSEQNVFTDRYQALGIPYPNPRTMCHGQCEGTGWIPTYEDETEPELKRLWEAGHTREHKIRHAVMSLFRYWEAWYWRATIRDILRGLPCDGCHFVKCPDCAGTGKVRQ